MLDSGTDLVHFFKKTSDSKPYQSLSLNGGILSDDLHLESEIVDEETGEHMPGFKFQFVKKGKKKGNVMTVIPEKGLCPVMLLAFKKGIDSNQNLTSKMKTQSSLQAGQEQQKKSHKRSGLSRMSVAINNAPEILTFSS